MPQVSGINLSGLGSGKYINVTVGMFPVNLQRHAVSTTQATKIWRAVIFNAGRRALRQLNKTIETWEASHKAAAKFNLSTTAKTNDPLPRFIITQNDEVWWFLSQGTRNRFYRAIGEYTPKTYADGDFQSIAGGGAEFVFQSRDAKKNGRRVAPIEARRWADLITERVDKELSRDMDVAAEMNW